MNRNLTVRRSSAAAAVVLSFAALGPSLANATPVNLSGTVNDISTTRNGSPFSVDDTLSGSFDVNLQADNSFDKADVSNFELSVGPNTLYTNADLTLFSQFRGQLSDDGSTVSSVLINNTGFTTVPGLENAASVTLGGFNPQTFDISAASSSSDPFGSYTVNGNFNATVGATQNQDVPEPSSLGLLGLGALLMGFVGFRRKQTRDSV